MQYQSIAHHSINVILSNQKLKITFRITLLGSISSKLGDFISDWIMWLVMWFELKKLNIWHIIDEHGSWLPYFDGLLSWNGGHSNITLSHYKLKLHFNSTFILYASIYSWMNVASLQNGRSWHLACKSHLTFSNFPVLVFAVNSSAAAAPAAWIDPHSVAISTQRTIICSMHSVRSGFVLWFYLAQVKCWITITQSRRDSHLCPSMVYSNDTLGFTSAIQVRGQK